MLLTRRQLLHLGVGSYAGMSLAGLLSAQAAAEQQRSSAAPAAKIRSRSSFRATASWLRTGT